MLLPRSSAPISLTRIADRLETMAASRLPCFESRNMLARDAPVIAVSLAAKNAETSRQAMRMETISQSMTRCSLHPWLQHDLFATHARSLGLGLARQLGLQKIPD